MVKKKRMSSTPAIENVSQGQNKNLIPREAIQFYVRGRALVAGGKLYEAYSILNEAVVIARQSNVVFPEAEALKIGLAVELARIKKPTVFISYSKIDFDIASEIYHYLSNNGCDPWMDIFNLVPGQDWDLEITENIRSSDFFVACLSNRSVTKRGYIHKELKQAFSALDEIPEGEIFIIPIRIDECKVPSKLSGMQWLDWFEPDAKVKLLRAIDTNR